MADSKKYDGGHWEHSLRKETTATEIIVPPTTIYCDGSNATLSIKGNTSQSGTPTTSNPVPVLGVGELDGSDYKIPISNNLATTPIDLGSTSSTRAITKYVCTGDEQWGYDATFTRFFRTFTDLLGFGLRLTPMLCTHYQCVSDGRSMANVPNHAVYTGNGNDAQKIFFKEEDISSESAWKNWLAEQYANGTPVILYYILETATTGTVNEPLMKIGDYADSISGISLLTTDGANTITVDTTVQPSEVSATYTGWHDSTVKEWDGSQWE